MPTLPVAEYLRMSTEHQQYSLDNQHATIAAYAYKQGYDLVKTYTDGARSGVVLTRRNGLRQLLQDVMTGEARYRAILVYDVSRWGRFQDADEAAHYEFLCKSAGIPVHYCAEPFVNDGALQNTLMKALKRTMAGEYSRELGVKVFAGLKRLATLGFKQGGLPGYGLRRMLVYANGEPKQILSPGERKSIASDRVILIPGPEEEVEVVREIYRLFLKDGLTVHAIARYLNRRGVVYGSSRWSHHTVQQILSHPKYAGCNVFGRTSQKLGTKSVRVPETEWVRTPGAFVPVVDNETSRKAHRILLSRTTNKSDADILDQLKQLLAREGRLSLQLIKKSDDTPSPSTYRERFGSLRHAYELIGYGKPEDFGPIDLRRRTQAIREDLMRSIQAAFSDRVTVISKGGRWRSFLRLANGRFVTVLIARSVRRTSCAVWQIDPVPRECRRTTLLVLLNHDNCSICEMRLFPCIGHHRRFTVREGNLFLMGGKQLESLRGFYNAVTSMRVSKETR